MTKLQTNHQKERPQRKSNSMKRKMAWRKSSQVIHKASLPVLLNSLVVLQYSIMNIWTIKYSKRLFKQAMNSSKSNYVRNSNCLINQIWFSPNLIKIYWMMQLNLVKYIKLLLIQCLISNCDDLINLAIPKNKVIPTSNPIKSS